MCPNLPEYLGSVRKGNWDSIHHLRSDGLIIEGPPFAVESATIIVEESKIDDQSTTLKEPTSVEISAINSTYEDQYEAECQQSESEIYLQLPEGISTEDIKASQSRVHQGAHIHIF